MKKIHTPLDDVSVRDLKAGDEIYLDGIIYTARDAAHKLIIGALADNKQIPFNPFGQVIYYTGPTPCPPGKVIGSCGPTTSSRMDPYTIPLLEAGLKGMIGKGPRDESIREACARFGAVYFVAIGGAGALIAKSVMKSKIIAYPELGPEAVCELEVSKLPLWVAIDSTGHAIFQNS
ncbi:MAG: FumA C-terminus/TtdB family hydratase beta subunit [Candidatus Theseobacter exili]|nr:FumA C-terminus/TtdB family hydratase beta subunit [Candidatus Theseobacter exili]